MTLTRAQVQALVALTVLLAVAGLAATMIGPVNVPVARVVGALGRLLTSAQESPQDALVTQIRLPRVLLAMLVGGALSVAGAGMQAVFGNPLAEPGITGVSAGAAVVAVALIVTGLVGATSWLLLVGAFVGAILATAVVQAVGYGRAGTSTASLLLVGMALNAFLGAVTSGLIANADDAEDSRSAMFWLNGDLTGSTMADVGMVAVPILVGVAGVMYFGRELNMLALGEATAQSAGVNVRLVSNLVLGFAALAAASSVAATGIIAFVGLVVPHLVRLLFGVDHTFLLPACFLLGGIFLTAADTAARMIFNPIVLQTGTLTALVGAPFLLYLVLRRRSPR
ncbi:FecCD family ABC transporter permease [Salana multivorans]